MRSVTCPVCQLGMEVLSLQPPTGDLLQSDERHRGALGDILGGLFDD